MPIMVQVTGMVMETLSTPESEAEELEEIKKLPESKVMPTSPRVMMLYASLLFLIDSLLYSFYGYIIAQHRDSGDIVFHES